MEQKQKTEWIKLKGWCGTVRLTAEPWATKSKKQMESTCRWVGRQQNPAKKKNSNGRFQFGRGLVRKQQRGEEIRSALAAPRRVSRHATQLPWLPWRDTPPCRRWFWATRPRSPLWGRWWPRATERCPFYRSLRRFSCRRGNAEWAGDIKGCRNWWI